MIAVDAQKVVNVVSCLFLVGQAKQQPSQLNYNVMIPNCALEPPNFRTEEVFMWYPFGSASEVGELINQHLLTITILITRLFLLPFYYY